MHADLIAAIFPKVNRYRIRPYLLWMRRQWLRHPYTSGPDGVQGAIRLTHGCTLLEARPLL